MFRIAICGLFFLPPEMIFMCVDLGTVESDNENVNCLEINVEYSN